MSLRELARRVGVSPSLVSQIELDRVNPSVSTLYALVSELGMTMSDVFVDGAQPAPRVHRLHPDDDNGLLTHPTRDASSTSPPECGGNASHRAATPMSSFSTSCIRSAENPVPRKRSSLTVAVSTAM